MTPRSLAFLLRAAYVAVIALATVSEPSLEVAAHVLSVRFEEAVDPAFTGRDIVDALRNVLLFAGWGAVWLMTAPRGPARPVLVRATISGAVISIAVETFQLIVPTRTPSLIDFATNTVGAFIGALGAGLMVVFVKAGRGERSFVGVPAAIFAGAYGSAVLLEAFSPLFRQERLLGAWGSPGERLAQAWKTLEWSSVAQLSPIAFLLAIPAGFFVVAALVEAGKSYGRAWPLVAGVGAVTLFLAEFSRGAVGHMISLGPAVSTSGGLMLGAWSASRVLPVFSRRWRGSARPRMLWWVYVGLLLLWAWRPFYPEMNLGLLGDKLSLERFIPLLSYRERVDVFTAVDVAVTGLIAMPAGGLLAAWPLRLRGWLSGVLPVLYVACAAEFGQIIVAGRYFDATDLLIQSAAAFLGWAMIRRAGYNPYGEALKKVVRSRSPAR